MKTHKVVPVTERVHRIIKTQAAKKGITIIQYLDRLVEDNEEGQNELRKRYKGVF